MALKAEKSPNTAEPVDTVALADELTKVKRLLMAVEVLLADPLPHHGPDLVKALTKIDAWLYTCSSAAVKMHGLARKFKTVPTLRTAAEHLEAAVEAIKRRISLGQSLLRFLETEINAQLNRVGR
jgi:hypothetical protein